MKLAIVIDYTGPDEDVVLQKVKDALAKDYSINTDLEVVRIDLNKIDELLKDSSKLHALEGAGVDNWEGYDEAMETLEDENQLAFNFKFLILV